MRRCPCGQALENRGTATRQVFTCLGPIALERHWWGSRCPGPSGGYRVDDLLGLDGGLCQHIAATGRRVDGEGSVGATRFHEHGRELLLKEGWNGVCRLICEERTSEDTPSRRRELDRLLNYFLAHMNRID